MPLEFTEIEKPKVTADLFKPNPNARPWELEGEVVPELLRRCGDVKAGRMSIQMVERYLDKNVLVFNRDLLKDMFAEADFRKEGSLDKRALKAALSPRYPKRLLRGEWRQLAALLLGVSELTMCEDIKHPKYFEGVQHSILDGPPPTLPKISKKTYRTKIMKQPPPPPPPTDATTTATTTTITAVPPPGKVLTPAGLKDTAPVAPRPVGTRRADTSSQPLSGTVPPTQLFGRSSSAGSQGLGATQRSTFSSVEDLERFAQCLGLSLAPDLKLPTWRDLLRPSKMSVRAYSASLPPSPLTLPSSALHVLRDTVSNTRARKPAFSLCNPTLSTSVLDLKKTLGQPLDVTTALNRVEPVRPDKVLLNAGHVVWADYCKACPTNPDKWFNEHPAAPAPSGAGLIA